MSQETNANLVERVKSMLEKAAASNDKFFSGSYPKINAIRAHRWITEDSLIDSIRWVEKYMPEVCDEVLT